MFSSNQKVSSIEDEQVTVAPPVTTPLPHDHPFNRALARQRAKALEALAHRKDGDSLFDPLLYVIPMLERYEMLAADGLGERGFAVDDENQRVLFNRYPIERIIRHINEQFGGLNSNDLDKLVDQSVGLYLYHELFHIEQNFENHELAQIIKEAFGPDELSKIDVYADVVAAHCQTLVDLSGTETDIKKYLEAFGSNISLSYEILSGAFESVSPHKKRRGLGLMTSRLLVERAINSNLDDKTVEEALAPVYTSVSLESSHIIALTTTGNGWIVLFYAQTLDKDALSNMWDRAGTAKPRELLSLLYAVIGNLLE